MDRHNDYLYHYTSIDTLALILTNRTICFNSLQYVDDIEEAETNDVHNFGKYLYVSCWTDDEKESISLWSLYTPNMHGVRIGLPRFPFVKHSYRRGQYFFVRDTDTYINVKKVYEDNTARIVAAQPTLEKVKYVKEHSLLYPNIKEVSSPDAVERFLSANSPEEVEDLRVYYSFEKLGRHKRKDWEFQNEWRYIIAMAPLGMKEKFPSLLEEQKTFIRRLEDPLRNAPYDRFFLELDSAAVDQMEIVLGPCMSESEKIYVKALLKTQGLENNWKESSLRIRKGGHN